MEGYICVNPNRITEEEENLYQVGNVFSSNDNEMMVCGNIEDCFRNKHAMTEDVVVFKVTGNGIGRQVADTQDEFIDQYMFHEISFDKALSREEVIEKGLNLPSTRAPRFVQYFKLTEEEIEAFINRFKNDGEVLRAIAWHQLGQHNVYKEYEDELRKGAKN